MKLKRNKLYVVLFMLFCLLSNNSIIKAEEYTCDKEEYAIYKKLADQIKVSFKRMDNYYNEDGSVNKDYYMIEVNGLHERLALFNYEIPLGISGLNADDGNYTTYGIKNGTYTFYVKAFSAYCKNEIFRTITINIPKYNVYADREECDDVNRDKFVLCNPNYQNEIEEDTFIKRLAQYKKDSKGNKKDNKINNKNENKDSNDISKVNTNWFDKLLDFLKEYYLIIIFGIVIIIVVVITFLKKKTNGKKKLIKKNNFTIEVQGNEKK